MYPFLLMAILLGFYISTSFAAVPIDLRQQPENFLQLNQAIATENSQLVQIKREVDSNQTEHIRLQQRYKGYLVWGTESMTHISKQKNASLQGMIYQKLADDLPTPPPALQMDKVKKHVLQLSQKKWKILQNISNMHVELIVYVNSDNKAHWAYFIYFSAKDMQGVAVQPTYIIDAFHFVTYQEWNSIQTLSMILGGGYGGNKKAGKIIYDGIKNDFPELQLERDDKLKMCYLKNPEVIVKDVRYADTVMHFKCDKPDAKHHNVFWDGEQDHVNDAYSPGNDALFIGKKIKQMYQDWYGIPVLVEDNKPMLLTMRVHDTLENAYWNGKEMTFGDGGEKFYPLVSLEIGAHEISHGFTEQHAHLEYYGQSGALNESFSDMASKSAEFYVTQKNNWHIGDDIVKEKNKALRYMDDPVKDCVSSAPGVYCSIDHVKYYHDDLDVHYGSGIYNKIFYLLATEKNWDTKKAFDVMVQANRYYWTSTATFAEAACGVLAATKDLKYDLKVVRRALKAVGLNDRLCRI